MVKILTQIIAELSPLLPIGAEWIQENTAFPYGVFSYSNREQEKRNMVLFTLDIWDKNTSILPLETICSQIRKKLDGKKWNTSGMFASSYFATIATIPDPDPLYKRRRMTFTLYFYDKEVTQ